MWGGLASYTSFFAHAGQPPYAVYILPQRLPNTLYAGTTIMFFATVNALKLPPYLHARPALDDEPDDLGRAVPDRLGATLVGIWLVRRVPANASTRCSTAASS